jgi:HEAT repeat protein
MAELVALGAPALPRLRDALKDPFAAHARPHAEECIKWIDGPEATDLVRAVLRQVARRQPDGTAAALLAFLTTAGDEALVEEARLALVATAVRAGRVDPALEEAAVKDPDPLRRQLAVEALVESGDRAVIRRLLREPSRETRVRAAGLRLDAGDPEAVPVLVELLEPANSPEARAALDHLQRLAGPLGPAQEANAAPRRETWAAWWGGLSDEALLKYLRDRTPDVDPGKIPDLVRLLGAKSFRAREKAEADLVHLRGLAVPHLERALVDADLELRRRAERCLQAIHTAPDAGMSSAHLRLVGLRGPAGAARAVLGFAAFADSESVTEEARGALRLLARSDPGAAPLLRAALADRAAPRRALAAEVLAEMSGEADLKALRKLLEDPEPLVRHRAALGLAARGEREAVPAMIALLTVLPQEQAWQVEDALRRLADAKTPPDAPPETDAAGRARSRQLWEQWWARHGGEADLTALRRRPAELGLTLLSLWESGANLNYLVEMGRDRQQRWRINDLGYAFDFIVLPGNRLLMAEHNKHRVTERNFRGEVLWEFSINSPINCQRLPNGHVFVASADRCVIVDRQKNEVLKVDRHGGLMGGQRMRDGKIVLVNGSGKCFVLDPSGVLLREFQVEGSMNNYGGIQELPGGRFLLAQHDRNRVTEYDLEGKRVWSAESPSPNFATRLGNGHTLVGSQDNRSLTELDREGKIVSRYEPGVSVWRVRRR